MVFLALLWYAGPSALGRVWGRGAPALMAAAAGMNVVLLVLKTWRWERLLGMQGIEYGFRPALRAYMIGAALAAWTPGRLGDFSRALALRRERDVTTGRAVASVLADRLLDAAAMAAVAAVSLAALAAAGPAGVWSLAAVGIAAAAAAAALAAGRSASSVHLRAWTRDRLASAGRVGEETAAMLSDLLRLLRASALGAPALLTAVATLATFAQAHLLARALQLDVGFARIAGAAALASVASLLPISVAGLGAREAGLLLMLSPAGVGVPEVVGYSLAFLVVVGGSLAALGAAAWAAGTKAAARESG